MTNLTCQPIVSLSICRCWCFWPGRLVLGHGFLSEIASKVLKLTLLPSSHYFQGGGGGGGGAASLSKFNGNYENLNDDYQV